MQENFFSSAETASRYNIYRPALHGVIAEWLADAGLPGPYRRAIDVACGTGHSTLPLQRLAQRVDAIDLSPEMVAAARASGIDARVGTYQNLSPRTYDLIRVCMAFHWFDRDDAVRSFLAASAPGAVWLTYNFGLGGHETNAPFAEWLNTWYRVQFPAPGRGTPVFRPTLQEESVELITDSVGALRVAMDREALIGYLTTQTNVEHRIGAAYSYADAARDIDATMPQVADATGYIYALRYTICRMRSCRTSTSNA